MTEIITENTAQTTEQVDAEAVIALKKEYEGKLAIYEAELAQLKAQKQSEKEKEEKLRHENEEYLEEYVSLKLFRDNDKYKDDVYVAVNGKNCIIKRGEWVKVKRKFALVIDQSEIQDMQAADFMENEQKKFSEESEAIS